MFHSCKSGVLTGSKLFCHLGRQNLCIFIDPIYFQAYGNASDGRHLKKFHKSELLLKQTTSKRCSFHFTLNCPCKKMISVPITLELMFCCVTEATCFLLLLKATTNAKQMNVQFTVIFLLKTLHLLI